MEYYYLIVLVLIVTTGYILSIKKITAPLPKVAVISVY